MQSDKQDVADKAVVSRLGCLLTFSSPALWHSNSIHIIINYLFNIICLSKIFFNSVTTTFINVI